MTATELDGAQLDGSAKSLADKANSGPNRGICDPLLPLRDVVAGLALGRLHGRQLATVGSVVVEVERQAGAWRVANGVRDRGRPPGGFADPGGARAGARARVVRGASAP